MTLQDLRTYLLTLPELSGYSVTIGTIDGDKECQIGLYPRRDDTAGRVCIGGEDNTSYDVLPVDILVHGTRFPLPTLTTATALCDQLRWLHGATVGSASVLSVSGCKSPSPCGKDRRGVFEYVINASFNYDLR